MDLSDVIVFSQNILIEQRNYFPNEITSTILTHSGIRIVFQFDIKKFYAIILFLTGSHYICTLIWFAIHFSTL